MTRHNLTELASHFAFGENWHAFSNLVTDQRIAESERGLEKLFPDEALVGRRMLDIGCGSGLSMLSALRLGAERVDGFDLDPKSTETARMLLSQHYSTGLWSVQERSIFELESGAPVEYDIVYSWGVLHHTGDMWRAIKIACSLVASGGLLCIALYRRTPMCALWAVEKRFYSGAPAWVQRILRAIFEGVFVVGLILTGRNPRSYIANYKVARGMDWHHDVHDWLGGYPYESLNPTQIAYFLEKAGFVIERSFERRAAAFGLFGSHCDEFVARRI